MFKHKLKCTVINEIFIKLLLINKRIYLILVDQSNSEYIEIEYQQCKYHHDFRLYLMTKQTNPKMTTSIYSSVTVINCSITQEVSILKSNVI